MQIFSINNTGYKVAVPHLPIIDLGMCGWSMTPDNNAKFINVIGVM